MSFQIFQKHYKQARQLVQDKTLKTAKSLYDQARLEMQDRLQSIRAETMDKARLLREAQNHVTFVAQTTGRELGKHLREASQNAVRLGAEQALREIARMDQLKKTGHPAVNEDGIRRNLEASIKQDIARRQQRAAASSVLSMATRLENHLTSAVLGNAPFRETVQRIAGKQGLLEQERWKAERILNTETSYAHNSTKQETLTRVEEASGVLLFKRLIETIDDRTGDDSFIIHGQVVRAGFPFSWKHRVGGSWVTDTYMFPPNRPLDRAVVIPWRQEWTPALNQKALSLTELRFARTTRWRDKPGVEIPPGHVPGQGYV